MCGIAGQYLRNKNVEIHRVQSMCDQIRHRGPDDEGYHIDGRCGLGMRRLSIIDLTSGHQPISNEDGSVWVVFNGEIYNFQHLRPELIHQGHRFKTNSDTETLVHLYEQEGVGGLPKLRGMFAFAIWDARNRSLLLVRDRFGKKPLYYAARPEGLTFGSELKCLRAAGVPLDIDYEALRLYLQFGYIPEPWSPYCSIRKLAPGGWLRYDANGCIEQGGYWTLPAPVEQPSPELNETEAIARVREIFDEAVRLRMIAEVPLGAFLSGGIDSSSIVASMAMQSKDPVKTFSIGFAESNVNELPFARMIADKYGTEHHEIIVKPDSLDLITRVVQHCDEPFGDAACIPTFILSEFAVQKVKVALTGDGGDEIFGGYESFFTIERMRWADRIPQAARAGISWIAECLPYSAYGKNFLRAISRPSALERYFEMNSMPYFLRKRLLESEWILPADAAWLTQTLAHCLIPNGADLLSQGLYFEATAKLTGDMLVKVDRMSMAKSLEVRCPLLDHELAELAARIPHAWKLSHNSGKLIFLKAVGDRLPAELVNRKKMGFNFPLPTWFRGPLRSFLVDHLTSEAFRHRRIASDRFVRLLLDEHQTGRRDNSHWLFMLLMLELWFREDAQLARATKPAPEVAAWQVQ